MKRERLTPERIRLFSCPAEVKQAFFWDTVSPRLAVRATTAAKSFIFEAKLNRKTIRTTIGDVRAWNLDDARAESNRLQSLVDQGTDPREQKKERIAASEAKREESRRLIATVSEAWAAYLEERKAKWSARHLFNHEALAKQGGEPRTRGRRPGEPDTTMPGPIFPLLALKLSALDADTVGAWLEKETERGPGQAAQAYRALRAFVGWCAEHKEYAGAVHVDACTAKAVREIAPTVGAKKDDVLQREMLHPWFEAVGRIHNPTIAAYLRALLLTGARREELAGLTWDNLDFQWKAIRIHDKVKGERVIPLTPYVASLLATLPRRKDKEGKPLPWVFSSATAANGRIQEPRIAHVHALQAAGLPHVSLHGLRRSFGSLAEWTEAPVGVVAQVMGHAPSALAEKHYRERPLDLLRMWHEKIEAWILEQAGIEQPKEEQAGLRLVKA
jgi:integrase